MAILVVDATCLAEGSILHVREHPVVYDATGEAPVVTLPLCETRLPAAFCACGQYALLVEADADDATA